MSMTSLQETAQYRDAIANIGLFADATSKLALASDPTHSRD
jgi:hypothetical protein